MSAVREDLGRFAVRLPVLVAAAVIAQAAGDAGTALVRDVTGMSGLDSTAVAERLLTVAFATPPAAVILSLAFAARVWSWPEVAVVGFATLWSFWLGPAFYAIGKALFPLVSGGDELTIRGNYAGNLFWAAGIALVMAPAEFYVWRSMARERVRAVYARIRRASREVTSADARAARSVRLDLRRIGLVNTSETAPLVDAIRHWYALWLANPGGTYDEAFAQPAAAVDREVLALFGLPRQNP